MKKCERCKDRFLLQTKEDCRFYKRCCRDQTAHVHPLHRNMATGTAWNTENMSFWVCSQVRKLYLILSPQAMSLLLLPHNIPDSLKHLSTLMDDIWYYAGDRSTDVSGSCHPSSSSSSSPPHSFLSPFHHHPQNIRPATSQVTAPIDTSLCPCWYTENTCFLLAGRCHLSIYIKTANDRSSQQIISQILFN